jgi:mRNA-degrading endonuclease YafQ of YafQ-DinJ toxin-antitoxin module
VEKITTYNYEAFYLDYLEGNLNTEQTRLLFNFLEEHPDLKSNLDPDLLAFNIIDVDHNIVLEDQLKNKLKKSLNQNELVAIENLMIEAIEQQLSPTELQNLQQTIKTHQLEQTYNFYKATKLNPDLNLVFPFKKDLKQKEGKLIPLLLKISAVAALLVLLFNFINPNTSEPLNTYTQRHNVPDLKFNSSDLNNFNAEDLISQIDAENSNNNKNTTPKATVKSKQKTSLQDSLTIIPEIENIPKQIANHLVVEDPLNNIKPNNTSQQLPSNNTNILVDNIPKKEPLKLIDLYEPVTKTVNNHTALDVTLKKSTPDSEYEVMQVKIGKFSFERKRKK